MRIFPCHSVSLASLIDYMSGPSQNHTLLQLPLHLLLPGNHRRNKIAITRPMTWYQERY